MGLWNCACTWQPYQRHWPCHDQASLQKVQQVTTWLNSFCLAEFQQFYSEIFFFQFRFSLFPPACMGSCSVFAFGVLWFFCFVLHKMIGFFGFFGLKFSNCSPLKLIFSEGPYFLYVLFVIMGLWNCTCTRQPCQRHWPCHEQASLQKNEQVTTWLLSFCLAEFQQLYSEIFFSISLQFISSCLHGFMFSFCPWGLVVLLFCPP